jgi:hypothetical protein
MKVKSSSLLTACIRCMIAWLRVRLFLAAKFLSNFSMRGRGTFVATTLPNCLSTSSISLGILCIGSIQLVSLYYICWNRFINLCLLRYYCLRIGVKIPIFATSGALNLGDDRRLSPKMRFRKMGNKGSAVVGVMIVVVMLMVGVIILNNLNTAFAGSFYGGTYSSVYNSTTDNSVTATSLMALLPILLGAGILIAAVMGFAGKK